LIYGFGQREGMIYIDGFTYVIYHDEIGLITLPTVSSERFEITIKRQGTISGENYEFDDDIKVYLEDNLSNGDKVPDEIGALSFVFDNTIKQELPEYSIHKVNENHLRVLCYNSLFDGLFENSQREAQRRIIKAMNPDIIGFQEIYEHDANEIAAVIESILPLEGGKLWYRAKISPDLTVVSDSKLLVCGLLMEMEPLGLTWEIKICCSS